MTAVRSRANGAVATAAIVFFAAGALYIALGNAVSHVPPSGIDTLARGVTGEYPQIAWQFTKSCLWPVLTTFGIIGCILAVRYRAWRGRIVFAIVTTIVAWRVSDVFKDLFARPRPSYWIVFHEPTYAYSSGHAMFATIVYWLWAYHAARSPLPAPIRIPLAIALAAWGGGVIWSRLALGAHYPTDLIGGILLAIAMLALARVVAAFVAPRARVL